VGGLKVSVKHKNRALSQQEEWQDKSNHSSFPPLLHLYILEGLLSFWRSLRQLSVCMDTALREEKGLAVHPPFHLACEEMGAFLLLLEMRAMGTQNQGLDANLF